MNGKKHNAKVVKLAEAAKSSKVEQVQQKQQQQQPSGKKRKVEPKKPVMIGIQDNEYWCFPCSVSGWVTIHFQMEKGVGKGMGGLERRSAKVDLV